MPKSTSKLYEAKKQKNDEFYTQLPDIDKELKHYKEHFKWKIIFCNCDDPYESNFFKYFAANFNFLWLKKLIATWYSTSPIAFSQLPLFEIKWLENEKPRAYKIEINEVYDANDDWAVNLADVEYLLKTWKWKNKLTLLKWDWDFRSEESLNLLKQSDIVITNPPFSLFREYVSILMKYNKKFIILGNMNAITYKEIFSLIQSNKLWSWYWFNMSVIYKSPYENKLEANRKFVKSKWYDPDKNFIKVPSVNWYTNLEIKKRYEDLILYKHYTPEEYPKYDNYNAINVDKVSEIPCDYDWIMWVPITFLDKFNPNQFEIIWANPQFFMNLEWAKWLSNEFVENYYAHWWKWNYVPNHPILWYYQNGVAVIPYYRILIRRKK